ncbi:hypothetical protein [Citrobacter sedlakii]|uniref:hypothetical protein n=1 Tax=Citrobacter sedlakii TaxID=67826 RepID=UPI00397CBA62
MRRSLAIKQFNVIFPVICTLLGVSITALLGLYGNYLQTHNASKRACIIRLDKQESLLREKYNQFMVSVTSFSFSPTLTAPITRSDMRKDILPVIKSATEVMTYAPPELATVATNTLKAFYLADRAGDNPDLQKAAIKQAEQSFQGAYGAYRKALNTIDTQRKNCE